LEAWSFGLELGKTEDGQRALTGFFQRGEERMKLTAPLLVAPGLLLTRDRVARCAQEASFEWISALRKKCSIVAPESEILWMLQTTRRSYSDSWMRDATNF
jgi:hypothetical protein